MPEHKAWLVSRSQSLCKSVRESRELGVCFRRRILVPPIWCFSNDIVPVGDAPLHMAHFPCSKSSCVVVLIPWRKYVSRVCFHFWISWPSVAFGQTGRCFGQFLKVFKSRLMCSFFCMDGISYFVRREEFLWWRLMMFWFAAIHFFHYVAIIGWGTPFCSVVVMLMKALLFLALIPFQVVFQSIYFRVFVLRSVLASSSSCSADCICLLMSFWKPLWRRAFAYQANRSTEDALCVAMHAALSHLEKPNTYIRMLFVDYSSAFNTIVPSQLINFML